MDLDKILLKFGENDVWTIRDAVRGTQIFGGIGSGKSSGSGRTIAKQFLLNGFGGLVLCAKPDEKGNWVKMAREFGREDDLLIFEEGAEYQFNPLQYELTRDGKGAGEVLNLSNLFMAIYKMSNRLSGGGASGGGANSRFWDGALKRCLNRMIQLLHLAGQELSIANMRKIISNVPLAEQAYKLTSDEMDEEEIESLEKSNFCIKCILDAGDNLDEDDQDQVDEYFLIYGYFLREFPNLADETRMSIVESFLGIAEPFSTGLLKKYFAQELNLYPEETHKGKIIILNFAVKEYLDSGVYAQGIYKLLWQQATERRDTKQYPTPVFLWVDESQLFLSDYDQIFQTTARSSRACTVFISQNISNYYVAIGGNNPQARADSLLGNLGTKIFHSNNDAVTNEWASRVVGSDLIQMTSTTENRKRMAVFVDNISKGMNFQYLPQILPREFTNLRSGGRLENYIVEGIIQITGKTWSDGKNFQIIEFTQK